MISATGAYISIKNLSKRHGNLEVLRNINLEVTPGELTVLIGPSGCGKSTLLRCLNGLETLDSGTIVINGVVLEKNKNFSHSQSDFDKKARAIRENVGMVFQNFNLFPHLTLLENITKAPIVVKKCLIMKPKKKQKISLLRLVFPRTLIITPASFQEGSSNAQLSHEL